MSKHFIKVGKNIKSGIINFFFLIPLNKYFYFEFGSKNKIEDLAKNKTKSRNRNIAVSFIEYFNKK